MRMDELDWNPGVTKLRQFAILIILFGVLGFWASWTKGPTSLALQFALLVFAGLGLLGMFLPLLLRWPFVIWTVAVFPIGWMVSKIILLAIFFCIFMPIGLFFRILGRDALNLGPTKRKSFWIEAPAKIEPSRYFRQY